MFCISLFRVLTSQKSVSYTPHTDSTLVLLSPVFFLTSSMMSWSEQRNKLSDSIEANTRYLPGWKRLLLNSSNFSARWAVYFVPGMLR